MRVEVVKTQDVGVVVISKGEHAEEFWLPGEEWDKNEPGEWEFERRALTRGEELEVVLAADEKPVNGLRAVSRAGYSSADVGLDWLHEDRHMRVESASDKALVGRVGAVRAFAEMAPYLEFLKNRMLPEWAKDHGVLGKGDYIQGRVLAIDEEPSPVKLSIVDSLEDLARQEKDQPASAAGNDGTDLDARQTVPTLSEDARLLLSPVLLVEDHEELRPAMKAALERLGLKVVDTASTAEEASSKLANGLFRLVIIDVNLEKSDTDKNGFALLESQQDRQDRKLVLLTGEPSTLGKIERWGHLRAHGYVRKPCTLQDLADMLAAAAAASGSPWREFETVPHDADEAEQEAEGSSEGPRRAEVSKEVAVAELGGSVPGAVIHVFQMHPRSFRGRSIADYNGGGLNWMLFRGKLAKSVIKDTAIEGMEHLDHDPLDAKKHSWTLGMMKYHSFAGIPVSVPNARYKYALVAFHKDANAFGGDFQSRARLCAERVGRDVERTQLQTIGEEQSRFAATGMTLESLAHEIKNDICTISLRTDELSGIAQRAAPELSAADLEAVRELSGGLSGVALTANEKTRLLTGSAAEKGNVNVHNCLRIAASRCRAIAARTLENANRIRIDLPPRDTGEQWEVWAAPAALTIVFFNLYLNAAQQIDMLVRTGIRGGGRIRHTCERCVDEHGKEQAIVRIHDTGPGIHREDWDLIFKPGYTTKEGGTGLGLHICRYLVKEIGSKGRRADVMVARSTIWNGTTFTVKLPLETVSEGH